MNIKLSPELIEYIHEAYSSGLFHFSLVSVFVCMLAEVLVKTCQKHQLHETLVKIVYHPQWTKVTRIYFSFHDELSISQI